MIPKVIHYCWFGRNKKPELVQRCIASWRQYCPDYEIIEWNEDNFDVDMIPYTKDAYADKKWAFVSDYARLWIVYTQGGVYLDTDVLLKQTIEELLQYDCWLASEDVRYVSTGLGFGAIKGFPLIGSMKARYEAENYQRIVNSVYDTLTLEECLPDWKKVRTTQVVNEVCIVGMDNYGTYARHLATFSWKCETPEQVSQRMDEVLNTSPNKWHIIKWKFKRFLRGPR